MSDKSYEELLENFSRDLNDGKFDIYLDLDHRTSPETKRQSFMHTIDTFDWWATNTLSEKDKLRNLKTLKSLLESKLQKTDDEIKELESGC